MGEDTHAVASPEPAGWFGKLPMLGDFAQRRLPVRVVHRCDEWLAESIAASRASLGAQWLETYLSAPIWCFAWAPGVVDDAWWFGVLMPSVDAVGRYFPLVVAGRAGEPPADAAGLGRLADGYRAMAAAALGTLEPGATIERFEAALAGLAPLTDAASHVDHRDGGTAGVAVPEGSLWPEQAPSLAWPTLLRALAGRSAWWALAPGSTPASMRVELSPGLPVPERFAAMLEGRW